jgi:type VI secretion system protein ImpE
MSSPDELLSAGQPRAALDALQAQVRERAGDVKLRVLLFQLLCVLGQWDRAAKQLDTCGEMDDANLGMVAMYRDAVRCEALRAEVFAGRTTPIVAGQPAPWIAGLIEALRADGRSETALAASLRAEAFEAAPTTQGTIDGQPFGWIADADTRIGPVLEAVVNGSYQWIPFDALAKIEIDAPTDLRDLVWQPARLTLAGGTETVALLPVRYAETCVQDDEGLLLARRTEWIEIAADQYRGVGQRLFTTDGVEVGLLDLREVVFAGTSATVSVH